MYPTQAIERFERGTWVTIEVASTPEGHRRLARLYAAWSDLHPNHRYRVIRVSHVKDGEDQVVLS